MQLALARVEELQPKDARAPRWVEWEVLRVGLLVRLDRDDEALKRAAAIAERDAAASTPDLWRSAARAALKLGRGSIARHYSLRLLWGAPLQGAELRRLRFDVVESYLADRNVDEAYRSMLRFQQDFQPLERAEAETFVAALLEANRPHDAATWLGQLDANAPLAATLRMRAGLLGPDAAIALGRAMAAKGQDPDRAWRLVQEAAVAQRNRAIEIEAHEHRLALAPARSEPAVTERSAVLWRAYSELAQQTANQAQLLGGDVAAWSDRASRLLATQPQVARALFGHLAQSARDASTRGTAQLQLLTSLVDAKLQVAALRLFADPQRHPMEALDAHVRFVLGRIASESRRPDLAVRYWSGLATPAGVSPEQWRATNAIELMRAGMYDAGLAVTRALIDGGRAVPAAVVTQLVRAADELLERFQPREAIGLYSIVLALVQGAGRVPALTGLARSREQIGEARAAADAYLQAAVIASAPESDPNALRARELAAVNLARAGLREDARAQLQWLVRNARDQGVRESASRELTRL